MSAILSTASGKTKITLEYQADTEAMQSILGDASEYLFDKGFYSQSDLDNPAEYIDLTNREKADLLDTYIKKIIIDLANTHKSIKSQELARETEANNEYSL